MEIDISINSPSWRSVDNLETLVSDALTAARDVLADDTLDSSEVSVAFVDDRAIRTLNRQYRDKDAATNVLSFPHDMAGPDGAPRMLGDIVVAYETVSGEAARQGKTVDRHVSHLVIHGFLHLLGYDHETAAEADEMETLEIAVLAGLGVANPYSEAGGTGGFTTDREASEP